MFQQMNIDKLVRENTKKLLSRFNKLKGYVKNIDNAIQKHDQSMINKYYNKILKSYNDITTEQKRDIVSEMNKLHIKINGLSGKEV